MEDGQNNGAYRFHEEDLLHCEFCGFADADQVVVGSVACGAARTVILLKTESIDEEVRFNQAGTECCLAMHLVQNPSDDEVLQFVEAWIDDLAQGDYAAAFGRTEHDPNYHWTPDLMRSVVQGYGLPEPHRSGTEFKVTPRASALGGPPQRIVHRDAVRPDSLAEVWYDLPLNGEWSDLTATFRIEPRREGSVVVLQEIHVF